VPLLSKKSAQKYYEKLFDYHSDNRELAKKVRDFQHDLEHYILPEITGRKYFYDIYNENDREKPKHQRIITERGQLTWLYENKTETALVSNIQNLKVHRNDAEHKNEMDPITYMHCFQTMAKTIFYFSGEHMPENIEKELDKPSFLNNSIQGEAKNEDDIDPEIFRRIKKPIEEGLYIVKGTTPILYFGNYKDAKACTIATNPSPKEFYVDRKSQVFQGKTKRFFTREELGKKDDEELTDENVKTVLDCCNDYFIRETYNNEFFGELEIFINKYGYSFRNGSCVNLNLVQWATEPGVSDLKTNEQSAHLINDIHIIELLLNNKNFEKIFLNGKTVVKEFQECFKNCNLSPTTINNFKVKNGKPCSLIVYKGKYYNADVIGWSGFLGKDPLRDNDDMKKLFDECLK